MRGPLWPAPHRLAKLRFHELRYTAASYAIEASGATEASLVLVAKRLGHADISLTAKTYAKLRTPER